MTSSALGCSSMTLRASGVGMTPAWASLCSNRRVSVSGTATQCLPV